MGKSPAKMEQPLGPTRFTDVGAVALALSGPTDRATPSRLVRNIVLVLTSQVVIWVAGAGLAVLLPRFVSAEEFGRLIFAMSFTGIFAVFVLFGSERYLTREVARFPDRAPLLTFNALITRLPLFAIAACAIALFLVAFGYPAETVQLVTLFAISLFLTGIGNTFTSVLQGQERMGIAALAAVIERVFSGIIGLAVIVLAGKGMVAYAVVLLGANLLSVLIIGATFMRSVGLRWQFDSAICGSILRGGVPFFVWGLALFVYGSVDITMLSVMTDDDVVGWYGIAYRFIGIAGFFPFALTTALLPNISSMTVDQYRPLAQRCLNVAMFASIPIAVFFAIGAQSVIDFVGYPEEYNNSAILLRILAIHIPLVSFTMVGGTILVAANKEGGRTKAAIAAALLSPLLNLVFIPAFDSRFDNGAIGASIATCIVEFFVVIAVIRLLDRGTFTAANVAAIGRCLLAAVPMAIAMHLALPYGLLVVLPLGAAAYFLAALLTGAISMQELRRLPGLALGTRTSTVEPVDGMELSSGRP
jgi:O-antigen/teichoic acid export membrane protein